MARRRTAELHKEALLHIFMTLNIMDLIHAACVCKAWKEAAFDPSLWKIVDASKLKDNLFAGHFQKSSKRFMDIVTSASRLGGGNESITSLIFNFSGFITNEHLFGISLRTRNLRRLVLPVRDNHISTFVFEEAAKNWEHLESLTIPANFPVNIMHAIGKYCKNLTELKFMHRLDTDNVETIIACAPNLKVLSLECSMVYKDAILRILRELTNLEVLNISHSLILKVNSKPGFMSVLTELDNDILEEASRLNQFMFCCGRVCPTCSKHTSMIGVLFWSRNDPGIWLNDEVSSLAL